MKTQRSNNRRSIPSFLPSMLFATLLSLATGCGAETPATTQAAAEPTIDVAIEGRAFKLEVADDDAERQKGLMHRKSMPGDHGMLFVFQDVAPRAFWMKNTTLPLDIAYLDANGVVLNVAQLYPNDLSAVPSRGPAKFAIELNQGVAKTIGLEAGDHINVPTTSAK